MKKKNVVTLATISIFCLPLCGWVTPTESYSEDVVEPVRIFRTTIDSDSNSVHYKTNVVAYEDGHINITSQCTDYTDDKRLKDFSQISFNDTYIADVGLTGYSGTSTIKLVETYNTSYTTSFTDEFITYNVANNRWASEYIGKTLCIMDLYVKEPYINTEQILNINGTDIIIPFGTDNPNAISESEEPFRTLQEENSRMWTEISALRRENSSLKIENEQLIKNTNTILRLDTNNDGIITAIDASTILRIYAINSTGGHIETFEDLDNYNNDATITTTVTTTTTAPGWQTTTVIPEECDSGDLENRGACRGILFLD